MASDVHHHGAAEVGVVGLGYVGLTLAAALASRGVAVAGWDVRPDHVDALRRGVVPFQEPGVAEALGDGGRLQVGLGAPPAVPATVFVCTGTPVDRATGRVDLSQLEASVAELGPLLGPDSLVIIRSTVPIGTTRRVVLPILERHLDAPLLAFSPERTIQGRALDELLSLPQVVGGVDGRSIDRAVAVLSLLQPDITRLSSLEAAEMVKLACNTHTDVIYGYGNELALIAESLGLDADEVIAAANAGYPRPDLSRPGFVGGSCLTKDPYLLQQSLCDEGHRPGLVAAARSLNESIPLQAAERVERQLGIRGRELAELSVLLCGMAYKGRPETDDTRGAALPTVAGHFEDRAASLAVHDFVVPDRPGGRWHRRADLGDAIAAADVVMVLNDHPRYGEVDLAAVVDGPTVVYDLWGVWADQASSLPDGCDYLRLGRG